MVQSTRCRAKNPASCWKHGSGMKILNEDTVKVALREAKAELKTTNAYDAYESKKETVENLKKKLLFFSGGLLSEKEKVQIREELLAENEAAYKEAISNLSDDEFEKKALAISYEEAVAKLTDETPATVLKQVGLSSNVPDSYRAQWEESDKTIKQMEEQGYKTAYVNGLDEEYYYFYKPDLSDPGNWESHNLIHGKYAEKMNQVRNVYIVNKQQINRSYRKSKVRLSDILNGKAFLEIR